MKSKKIIILGIFFVFLMSKTTAQGVDPSGMLYTSYDENSYGKDSICLELPTGAGKHTIDFSYEQYAKRVIIIMNNHTVFDKKITSYPTDPNDLQSPCIYEDGKVTYFNGEYADNITFFNELKFNNLSSIYLLGLCRIVLTVPPEICSIKVIVITDKYGSIWQLYDNFCKNCIPNEMKEPTILRETTCDPELMGEHMAYYKTSSGCDSSTKTIVTLDPKCMVYVPNAFSPNSDGQNDKFYPFANILEVPKIIEFAIYGRWGELIYEDRNFTPNDSSHGWDGTTHSSTKNQIDLYVYAITFEDIDGNKHLKKGEFLLFR